MVLKMIFKVSIKNSYSCSSYRYDLMETMVISWDELNNLFYDSNDNIYFIPAPGTSDYVDDDDDVVGYLVGKIKNNRVRYFKYISENIKRCTGKKDGEKLIIPSRITAAPGAD